MNKMVSLRESLADGGNGPSVAAFEELSPASVHPLLRERPAFGTPPAIPGSARAAAWRLRRWLRHSHDYEWLLLLRFALANALALAFLGSAWATGYVEQAWVADTSRLSVVIVGVFMLGWMFACRAALQISRDLNRVRGGDDPFPGEPTDNVKERLTGRVSIVRYVANSLVLLGLIGTVIGFIVALSGVKPGQASDVSAIGPMVATLIHGMSIALYTTLVGSVFALWLSVLHRMLVTAATKLLCKARMVAHA